MPLQGESHVHLSLMGVVCDREKSEKVLKVLQGHRSFFNLVTMGIGTANSRILGYLGLGETQKAVYFNIMPTLHARRVLHLLDEKMDFKTPGQGVAYICPIAEGCYHKPVQFASGNDEEKTVEKTTHDLIMVILARGYTEDVMQVARAAGATGGTVIHARGCGLAGAEKFFGVTIQPEKDMIMILADRAVSCDIMSAIAEKAGPHTDSHAVSFSLPASHVHGIGLDVPAEVFKKK